MPIRAAASSAMNKFSFSCKFLMNEFIVFCICAINGKLDDIVIPETADKIVALSQNHISKAVLLDDALITCSTSLPAI